MSNSENETSNKRPTSFLILTILTGMVSALVSIYVIWEILEGMASIAALKEQYPSLDLGGDSPDPPMGLLPIGVYLSITIFEGIIFFKTYKGLKWRKWIVKLIKIGDVIVILSPMMFFLFVIIVFGLTITSR